MKIVELRNKFRLTQKELALILDVSVQSVSAWETEAKKPSYRNLKMMERHFNVKLDY